MNPISFSTCTYTPHFGNKQDKALTVKTEPKQPFEERYTSIAVRGYSMVAGMIGLMSGLLLNEASRLPVLDELQYEMKQPDNKAFKVEDYDGDKVPDIIVEKEDGTKFIYDIKRGSVNIDDNGELIEKLW